jgi:hypothetical protein
MKFISGREDGLAFTKWTDLDVQVIADTMLENITSHATTSIGYEFNQAPNNYQSYRRISRTFWQTWLITICMI